MKNRVVKRIVALASVAAVTMTGCGVACARRYETTQYYGRSRFPQVPEFPFRWYIS